jgi:hypothetical protein
METNWKRIAEVLWPLQNALNSIFECLGIVLEDEAKRDDFLHLAKRSSLYLVEKHKAPSSIELLIPEEAKFASRNKDFFVESRRELCLVSEFDSSTREGFVRLFRELCVGNTALVLITLRSERLSDSMALVV